MINDKFNNMSINCQPRLSARAQYAMEYGIRIRNTRYMGFNDVLHTIAFIPPSTKGNSNFTWAGREI